MISGEKIQKVHSKKIICKIYELDKGNVTEEISRAEIIIAEITGAIKEIIFLA